MPRCVLLWFVCCQLLWHVALHRAWADEPSATVEQLQAQFDEQVAPFLRTYCFGCHGGEEPEAKLDLTVYKAMSDVAEDLPHWELVLKRLESGEMPPEDAERQPPPNQRAAVVGWIRNLRAVEAAKNSGDPGTVLARRLSNAEYDYTIHDLTGVDIRPTREFPVDPANAAGFDNSGESLAMSPALLNKYLAAARHVADHVVLKPDGLAWAPHAAVTDTDRDKYCVRRIVDFYQRQPTDYADYFLAAWRYQHRVAPGQADLSLDELAAQSRVSARYLQTLWQFLTSAEHDAGPVAELRAGWRALPSPSNGANIDDARRACRDLRDVVLQQRKQLTRPFELLTIKGLSRSSQPVVLWNNRRWAEQRRRYVQDDDDSLDAAELAARELFCSVFPDTFYVSERARMFVDEKDQNKGRLLSAGFHLMVGYFRDDGPLVDLILDEPARRELDRLWQELDFVAFASIRQYHDFVFFERAEPPRFIEAAEFDFARAEDQDVISPEKLHRLSQAYLQKLETSGVDEAALEAVKFYFDDMSRQIRWIEAARKEAEPAQLQALLDFAERAFRRPLSDDERQGIVDFYGALREQHALDHEAAVRDTLVSVLMSPHFCFRIDIPQTGSGSQPLSDYSLASRLSYFLWSSSPDEPLLERARNGELRDRDVLLAETRRMLLDPRSRRLAVEFGGNWLEFRRFQRHNSVDRQRFSSFDDALREAMFQEPIYFLDDLIRNNGSVLDCLYARHTFVNPVLARHYQMPAMTGDADTWSRVDNADHFGRGGLLPMSVFLTANSAGLRTSPVKRGYWVVRRLLGEHIAPPPPDVPELPEDEADLGDLTLRQLLARHREVKSCAACHDRFDSIGVVFEGYGPIGERRHRDLGDKPVDSQATFPDGSEREGLKGLQDYLRAQREQEFIDNLCHKLLVYALGRSLQLSDQELLDQMRSELAADDYRFQRLVETIVTSPQFLKKRTIDAGAAGIEENAQ